jgi:type III secretion protein R
LLPFGILLATSYGKFVVVFSALRSSLGGQSFPPAMVTAGLSLLLTIHVMAPVALDIGKLAEGSRAFQQVPGATDRPAVIGWLLELDSIAAPLKRFLIANSSKSNVEFFATLGCERSRAGGGRDDGHHRGLCIPLAAGDTHSNRDAAVQWSVALPAFVVTELSEGFQIAFLVYLPFLVVDLLVANILLALGFQLLSPAVIALPVKLLLFVVADGWHVLVKALVVGYR